VRAGLSPAGACRRHSRRRTQGSPLHRGNSSASSTAALGQHGARPARAARCRAPLPGCPPPPARTRFGGLRMRRRAHAAGAAAGPGVAADGSPEAAAREPRQNGVQPWMRGPTALPIAPRALAPDCRSLSQPLSARPGWSRAPRLALARQAERWRRLGPRRRAQVWGFQTGDEGRLLAYRLSGRGGQTDYRAPRAALPRQHAGALAARPAGEGNQGGNETHASRPTQPMG